MNIGFDRPPISEVVVSMFFNPPLDGFRSEHVGRFWDKIKEDFPEVQQQVPFAKGFDTAISPGELFPMPRYWFIAADDATVIQIQRNAFMFNWRRRGDNPYPGFKDNIEPTFRKLYAVFQSFLTTELHLNEPTIDECELTYSDIIEARDYWTGPEDTSNIIPSFSDLSHGVNEARRSGFNCTQFYDVEDDIQLSIGIITAVDKNEPERHALRLEFKAAHQFGGVPKSDTDGWWQRAHDLIAKSFIGVTSEEVQYKQWGRHA